MLVAQDGRFRLLETLREFGREQLARVPTPTRSATRTSRCTRSCRATPPAGLERPARSASGWRSSTASFDDVRDAHRAAVAAGDVDSALRIVIGVREYAWRRIRYEHLTWADATVAMPGASDHELYPGAARASSRTGTSCAASSRPRSRSASARSRRRSGSARSPPGWPSGRSATPSSSGCSRPRRSGGWSG